MSEREADGILVYGLTAMLARKEWRDLTEEEMASDAPQGIDPDKDIIRAQSVSSDPWYFSWEMLDELIISGGLKAGAFDNCEVIPHPGTWPAKYRILKRI
jgi:hypothetical protein